MSLQNDKNFAKGGEWVRMTLITFGFPFLFTSKDMVGFGALRAMSDTNKHNRELLKSGKKEPFSQEKFQKSRHEALVLKEKPYSRELYLLIRANARAEGKGEIRTTIVVLVFSICAAPFIIFSFLKLGVYVTMFAVVILSAITVSLISLFRKDS